MNIGVVGSGEVAKTLAAGFLTHGHAVTIGTREPAKLADWQRAHAAAKVGSFKDAAAFGELVVLAVKGHVANQVLEQIGADALAGKTVIDTTNPIADAPPTNGILSYFTSMNESLMERLQKQVPGARFVKAFNSVGSGMMVNPQLAQRPSMFICGNDDAAKKTVSGVLTQFGWDTEDLGKVEGARAIEPLCILWCAPGFLRNDWAHALRMMRP
jgi:8-hydroxy-5-deazaflavin:NADPH oxidoreductase